ncbi:hypothetical protein [Nocardiopsis lambiniae]|uniref:Uncharacterized protein n=1 Tax=Nocardiopsis lambiniae TaxID=3075539 RepID=A0ABU2M6Y2_9ACTN|nr:hypothetical protein [Nocardiopsis sp. DSM 44743]MDT0328433.1 hypothetical protein [Nocardiopsis sp. DSM 44743]
MTVTTQRRPIPGMPPWIRALLLTVLLLGFGTMHTLGHAAHGEDASAAHAGGGHAVSGATLEPVAHTAETTSGALPELDPSSVCPAMKGPGLPLSGLYVTAFASWPEPAPAVAVPVLRRGDPPSVRAGNRPCLSELQVLRI